MTLRSPRTLAAVAASLLATTPFLNCSSSDDSEPSVPTAGVAGFGGSTGAGSGGSAGAAGSPGAPCSGPGSCALVDKVCCGNVCGEAGPEGYNALPRSDVEAYNDGLCPDPKPDACSFDCPSLPNPDVQAFCEGGSCRVIELSTHALSACASNDECGLAFATCCEPCGQGDPQQLVAIHVDRRSELKAQLCPGGMNAACPACVATPPPGFVATCDGASRHCSITKGPPAGG